MLALFLDRRSSLTLGVLVTLLGAYACGPTGERQSAAAPKKGGGGPTLVEVAKVRKGDLSDRWSFMGNVRALQSAQLASGAEGEAKRVLVREGQQVKKGQLLMQVDDRVARAKLRAVAAQVAEARELAAQARRELARLARLSKQARSELELERAGSNVRLYDAKQKVLEAQVAQARAELALHRVDAPFAGVVAKRHVDPGDWVKRGQSVVDVVSTAELEVLVEVSPRLLRFVREGDKAELVLRDGKRQPAKVVGVVGALDPVARTARVRLSPLAATVSLRPGAAVGVDFAVRRSGAGVVVQRDALLVGPVVTRVIKVVAGKAVPVTVDVVATASARALVVARPANKGGGLSVGDQVVVRGNERLRPGQAVRTGPSSKTAKKK